MINQIKAIVRLNQVYTCKKCGNQQIGDTLTIGFIVNTTEELKYQIDCIRQTSHYMPVGWSYSGEYNCGCNHERR